MSDAATWALGIDVGNAKLKLCSLRGTGVARHYAAALPWSGRDPYNRKADFEGGITAALAPIVADFGTPPACAVAVMSNGYSFSTHAVAAAHTLELLQRLLPGTDVRALAWNGELLAAPGGGLLACTNGAGAVHLARRLSAWPGSANGLVVDVGGTTTAITPLVEGQIDPAAIEDPLGNLDHRARHGKLVWIGSRTTPLESLSQEVAVAGRSYPVIPRGVTLHAVMALLNTLPERREQRLRLFQQTSDRAHALRAMADAIGVDSTSLDEPQLEDLARHFLQLAIQRLSESVGKALQTAPGASGHALLFGLGARALGRPALELAGIAPEAITFAEDVMPPRLSDVASVYGPCLAAMERVLGRELEPSFVVEQPQ